MRTTECSHGVTQCPQCLRVLDEVLAEERATLPLKWFVKKTELRGYMIYEGAQEGGEQTTIAFLDARFIAESISESHNVAMERAQLLTQ